jgi:hypothetical protein
LHEQPKVEVACRGHGTPGDIKIESARSARLVRQRETVWLTLKSGHGFYVHCNVNVIDIKYDEI